jgi:hypothetical protein
MPFSKSSLHGEENPLSAGGLKKDLAIAGFAWGGVHTLPPLPNGRRHEKSRFFLSDIIINADSEPGG